MNDLRHFAPEAVRDVEDATDWLANSPTGPPLARRFLTAVTEAAARISQRPLIGHRRTDLLPDPFRLRRVSGFPYLLVSMPSDLRQPFWVFCRWRAIWTAAG